MQLSLGESGILTIGTANFGSKYGIANDSNGIETEDLNKIFQYLNTNKSIGLDTASNYPMAEEIIGKLLQKENNRVNTKIGFDTYSNPDSMVESVMRSLSKTKRSKFNTIYLHGGRINNLIHRQSISEGLSRIIKLDFCETLGVSCYTKDEILETVENFQDITAFQVPENILDQRLINSFELMELSKSGIKFEVRSIFLQGSLLMDTNKMPKFFENYRGYFDNLRNMATRLNKSVFDLALMYALLIPWKSSIAVGVNNFQQFEKLISFDVSQEFVEGYGELKAPESLTDPRSWKMD